MDVEQECEPTNEISYIDDEEIEKEMLKYVRKAEYMKITDILLFVIPGFVDQNILYINNLVIYICISGDSRNVSRKIKHVIIIYAILDDILNIHRAEFHYMIILYPGNENYKLLQKVMELMINELHNLVTNGLDSNFNAANANYFCPWYLCFKKEIGTKDKVYMIEKTMEQLQTAKLLSGYSKMSLL
ncbi:11447_t:CDS:2 [Scutellospora calospora]|uniref:11447_t:CDS:1 n=1 Tax=Scutellospora calospora TaxID=85575 RepID=A0ACA9K8W5_9GLOM|nr:11447_t:CDS:2 [Scutellospora calospora]